MIKEKIAEIKVLYATRSTRERVFVMLLGWAFIYSLFHFVLFRPLDHKIDFMQKEINEAKNQMQVGQTQITVLKQLASDPVYKKWVAQQKTVENLQGQYQLLVKNSSTKQWQDIIKTILEQQSNIMLVQIKNDPETLYQPNTSNSTPSSPGARNQNKIYEQQLSVVINSDYFSTINYLKRLEATLPSIHWNALTYQVSAYPVGHIQLEFSILYEKND